MHELLTYTDSDFTDLASLMQELSGNIVFTRESLGNQGIKVVKNRYCVKIFLGSGFRVGRMR